jgi:hypothetical protein
MAHSHLNAPDTSGASAASGAAPDTLLDTEAVLELLSAEKYASAVQRLRLQLEAFNPACVDFLRGQAAHVVAGYLDARNMMHLQGRVPSSADVNTALTQGLMLLVRVAQDVDACAMVLAKDNVEGVLRAFFNKVITWLRAMRDRLKGGTAWWMALAPACDIVSLRVRDGLGGVPCLPPPSWVPFFSQSSLPFTTHFYFGDANDVTRAACAVNAEKIREVRNAAAGRFLDALRRMETWEVLLDRTLDQIRAASACPSHPMPPCVAATPPVQTTAAAADLRGAPPPLASLLEVRMPSGTGTPQAGAAAGAAAAAAAVPSSRRTGTGVGEKVPREHSFSDSASEGDNDGADRGDKSSRCGSMPPQKKKSTGTNDGVVPNKRKVTSTSGSVPQGRWTPFQRGVPVYLMPEIEGDMR